MKFMVRETTSADFAHILALYRQAFPDEDLIPLVTGLFEESDALSLAGFENDALVSHALITLCGTGASDRTAALLGPLGVMPVFQRQGLGSALVNAGLHRLRDSGVGQVFVLGDPVYYQRFGFAVERKVQPPYPLPEEWTGAWQSIVLTECTPVAAGRLSLPAPWMDPALWAA